MTSEDDFGGPRRQFLTQGVAILSTAGLASLIGARETTAAQEAKDPNALYYRLGGIFAIAAVIDYFSDAVVKNPVAGQQSKNPQLREWHNNNLGRLPGLKFMRTLWVANISGGPFQYSGTQPGSTTLGLEAAHMNLKISPDEFDAVAGVLAETLDHFKVPAKEKSEVLGAFAAHKNEVTQGYMAAKK